jgi:nudix-type nucleoside diphosphatase (YffH/AdpP family)
MLLVRQFRPAVYASILRKTMYKSTVDAGPAAPPFTAAFTFELCAGIVDKNKSLEEVAQEEVLEECGYDVPLQAIQRMTSYPASVGTTGSEQTLFFAQVDNSMKKQAAGGVASAGERIELLGLPLDSVEAFVMDPSVPKPSSAMFGLLWAKTHLIQRA